MTPLRSRHGIALVVTILVTAVVVVTVLATASIVTLGVRRGTNDEARSYRALLLAESAMNVARATVGAQQFGADEFAPNNANARAALDAVLSGAAIAAESVSNGTVTASSFSIDGGNGVAIEMVAVVGGATARVLLDFEIDQDTDTLALNVPAALTSIPRITVSGNASVSGIDDSEPNWVRSLGPATNAWSFGGTGSEAVVTTSALVAGSVQAGEYLSVDVGGVREVLRVVEAPPADGLSGNQLRLRRVTPSASPSLSVAPADDIEHRPMAVTGAFQTVIAGGATRIPVSYPGFYRVGDSVTLTGTLNGAVQDVTFLIDEIDGGEIVTDGLPAVFVVDEGTTVRRTVLGAITNSTITENGGGEVVGGVQAGASLVREDLFEQTFGESIGFVESLATAAGTRYTSWSDVPTVSGSNRLVEGITFVASGAAQNISFCGSGILIVVGNLQTNNAGCPFNGLIYVTGDWDERGNRNLTGAVVVEGLVTCSGEACVTSVAGTGAGNEDKLRYDPFALYSLALNQYPALTTIEAVDGSWRQR